MTETYGRVTFRRLAKGYEYASTCKRFKVYLAPCRVWKAVDYHSPSLTPGLVFEWSAFASKILALRWCNDRANRKPSV